MSEIRLINSSDVMQFLPLHLNGLKITKGFQIKQKLFLNSQRKLNIKILKY